MAPRMATQSPMLTGHCMISEIHKVELTQQVMGVCKFMITNLENLCFHTTLGAMRVVAREMILASQTILIHQVTLIGHFHKIVVIMKSKP